MKEEMKAVGATNSISQEVSATSEAYSLRQLGLMDCTLLNMGTMIGSGIFFVPAAIAQAFLSSGHPHPEWILLAWVLGGALSLFGALSIAELGAMMPEAGGQFHYLNRAYGPVIGYLYGWSTFLVINTAAIAAVAIAFAQGLRFFMPLNDLQVKVIALASLVCLTAVNWFGVKWGARVQNGLTLLKILAIVLLILFGLFHHLVSVQPASLELHPPQWNSLFLSALGTSLFAVLWAYDGWIQITYVAAEVKDPQKNLPQALIISTLGVTLLYVLINLIFTQTLGVQAVAASQAVAGETALKLVGPSGALLVSVAILISTFGANNGFILTGARVYYAMAKHGRFIPALNHLHPQWKTPTRSLLLQGVWAALLIVSGSFELLITHVVFVSWVFYALSAFAVIKLRHKEPDTLRPYKTWGYPFTPIVFILMAIALIVSAITASPIGSALGVGVILMGLPGYFYWGRTQNAQALTEGDYVHV
jgi:APA family basic amino acid/polyamine antiporter